MLVLQFLIYLPGREVASPTLVLQFVDLLLGCELDAGAAIFGSVCPAVGPRACEPTILILVLQFIDMPASPRARELVIASLRA